MSATTLFPLQPSYSHSHFKHIGMRLVESLIRVIERRRVVIAIGLVPSRPVAAQQIGGQLTTSHSRQALLVESVALLQRRQLAGRQLAGRVDKSGRGRLDARRLAALLARARASGRLRVFVLGADRARPAVGAEEERDHGQNGQASLPSHCLQLVRAFPIRLCVGFWLL